VKPIQVFALLWLAACGGPSLSRVKPQLVPPPLMLDFGKLPLLNERQLEIPLSNVGRARLALSNLVLQNGNNVFRIVSAPETVESGTDEKMVLAFLPLKEELTLGVLEFDTDDESNAHLTIALQGEGAQSATATLEPTRLDFQKVAECGSALQVLTVKSTGTADLIVEQIGFSPETSSAFSFVGSVKTPTVVKSGSEIQLTVRAAVPAGAQAPLSGTVVLKTTAPEARDVVIPLSAQINRAPVPRIALLTSAAPGANVVLDGNSSTDPDGDTPLNYQWMLRSKPLASTTAIAMPQKALASMKLDANLPGAYEVQLDVTDAKGVKACAPARATIVATPAEKLLVEMFWDNAGTDVDLHVLNNKSAVLFVAPDDCFYQNKTPDWGAPAGSDNPQLLRDALTGYGPEIFGYESPVGGTYRVAAVLANELLSATPSSNVTLRVYAYGILKSEVRRSLKKRGDVWDALEVAWPSGEVTVLP
jgi:hypothetical protein